MALYSYVYERPARKHFCWWHNWALRSRLQPMIEVTQMLKRRFENIITYLRRHVTYAGELPARDLLPLRRARLGSLATKMPEAPFFLHPQNSLLPNLLGHLRLNLFR